MILEVSFPKKGKVHLFFQMTIFSCLLPLFSFPLAIYIAVNNRHRLAVFK